MRWRVLAAMWILGCGPSTSGGPSADEGHETTDAQSSSTASAGSVTMPLLEDGSTTTDESSITMASDNPVFDIGTDHFGHCGVGGDMDVQLEVVTPAGNVEAMHAWWSWNYCCSTQPRLVVAEVATLDIDHPAMVIVQPSLEMWLDPTEEVDAPFSGEWTARLRAYVDGESADVDALLTLLSPIDPTQPADAQPFVANIEIDAQGWVVTGAVTAPHCADLDIPPCPCE